MTEIYKNLFVGNDNDCRKFEGAIVHAAKVVLFVAFVEM